MMKIYEEERPKEKERKKIKDLLSQQLSMECNVSL